MNFRAILLSFPITIAILFLFFEKLKLLGMGLAPTFFGIYILLAIILHIKPELMGKLNKKKDDNKTHNGGE